MKSLNTWIEAFWLAVLIFLVCAVAANAQTIAIIDGPSSALPGELVVLSSSNSKGDNHKWISPAGLSTAQAGCEAIASQLFFATPREGSYEFILVVSDKAAAIEFTKHTVVIKTPGTPVPPPVVNPPPVVDPPKSVLEQLKDLSKQNATRLNDPATRSQLATNIKTVVAEIKALCAANQCPTLAGAQSKVVKAIESTLLARSKGVSRLADWEQGWRVPNNQWIATAGITTVTQYLDAIAAIADSL